MAYALYPSLPWELCFKINDSLLFEYKEKIRRKQRYDEIMKDLREVTLFHDDFPGADIDTLGSYKQVIQSHKTRIKKASDSWRDHAEISGHLTNLYLRKKHENLSQEDFNRLDKNAEIVSAWSRTFWYVVYRG